MNGDGMEGGKKKRAKPTDVSEATREVAEEGESGPLAEEEEVEEETGALVPCSEEVEAQINKIFEKIEQFTEQVSEMLQVGKTLFKKLSTEFEERLIGFHGEQIQKWQEEIRELRLLDAANEEASALLQNTRYHLLQNVQMSS